MCIHAQEEFPLNDSLQLTEAFVAFPDSLAAPQVLPPVTQSKDSVFSPNSTRAVIYSAILPGLGQIYNRKYWKLPIVYGGALGCAYAITWNNDMYTGYRDAYRDFTDNDDNTNSWTNYTKNIYLGGKDPSEWTESEKSRFTSVLKGNRDNFRRYRDLSIIVSVGVYALVMIDAYVDAELFNFDLSPDLSMQLSPVVSPAVGRNPSMYGLQCSFTF